VNRFLSWGRVIGQFLPRLVAFLWSVAVSSAGFSGLLVRFFYQVLWRRLIAHVIWKELIIRVFWQEFITRILWQWFITRVLWRGLFLGLYLGYGERPERVLIVAIIILIGTTIAYWQVGTFVLDQDKNPPTSVQLSLPQAAYYSAVSFTALGYGSWAFQPEGWVRGIEAVESALGIFSVVFFSITFAQRITR